MLQGKIKRQVKITFICMSFYSTACIPFHKDDLGEAEGFSKDTSTSLSIEAAGPGSSTSEKHDFIKPGTLFRPIPQREQEEDWGAPTRSA
jgi:hypothetical protein